MWPLAGFAFGAVVGAVGVALRGTQIAEHARPAAKSALKAVLAAAHELHVRQAEIAEVAEDLFAEAEAEVKAKNRADVMAAAAKEQAAAEAAHDAEIRQMHILEAVQDLYAKAEGDVTSEQLASVISAAETRAHEAIEGARAKRSTRSSAAEWSKSFSKGRSKATWSHEG
jgi:hypothetical protein